MRTARRLIPKTLGLRADGSQGTPLRDALATNVKTLGGRNKVVSAIVGSDYTKNRHIHFHNNPVPSHDIVVKKKRFLSNLKNTAMGDKKKATVFGQRVKHPGFKGAGTLQQALEVNKSAIIGLYKDAIRKSVLKAVGR